MPVKKSLEEMQKLAAARNRRFRAYAMKADVPTTIGSGTGWTVKTEAVIRHGIRQPKEPVADLLLYCDACACEVDIRCFCDEDLIDEEHHGIREATEDFACTHLRPLLNKTDPIEVDAMVMQLELLT